ncbi:diguanylate cyclase [Crocosphaera sp. UHCC 0190]|uniref:diguanylate cyclase n=1 Tax=Crocosphaera sp. UHCC 0190 TaxID=3110246 RepID=UPI002B1FC653|nr:diguanylate cyclase [Crocosphaera sp. UHCC 0190]MEA5509007.1 diguanylate cyclase [Crocosphaera sp. UHCC 0190]
MKFQPNHRLDILVSETSPSQKQPETENQSVSGQKTVGFHQSREDSKQQLIAQLIAENQQLKQELKAKKQEIQVLSQQNHTKTDFEIILQGVADALIIVNQEGYIQFVNPAAEKLLGRSGNQLINHCLGMPVSNDETEITIFRPTGQLIIAEMRVAKIPWNQETAYLASLRDVTERQEAEAALKESEERFRLLADTAPVLIWMAGTQGEFTFVSQPWLTFTGQSLEEQLNDGWQKNLHPEDKSSYLKTYLNAFKKPASFEQKFRLKHFDGNYRWLLSRGVPRLTSEGEFVGYIGSCIDITEHKKLEETLLQISTAVESSSEAISILDKKGKSLYHNPAFVELFGYTPDTLNEMGGLKKIFCDQDYFRYQTVINAIAEGSNSWRGELGIRSPKGQKRQLCLHADGICDKNKQIIGIVITATDITERKRFEKELKQTNSKLKASVKQLEIVNHDIVMLGETIELLQACLSLDEAQKLLKMQVPRLFQGVSGSIFVFNQDNKLMEAMTTWGVQTNSELVFSPNDCWALRRGRLHTVHSGCGLLCSHVDMNSPNKNASLCLPMTARGETLGLIYLYDRKKTFLSEEKQQFVATVAEHLALALGNLKLRETLQQECIRDPLMGLFNRRYLEASLERELSRAKRHQQTLGVIMVDIDHFKRFNDDYSHEAGDIVLRVVGEFLQKSVRGSDIACRYGGEELTLILPDASLEESQYRAEELRQGIKQLIVKYQGQHLRQITASFGVASYPEKGMTVSQLLSNADAALYQAKAQGRDCVVMAT